MIFLYLLIIIDIFNFARCELLLVDKIRQNKVFHCHARMVMSVQSDFHLVIDIPPFWVMVQFVCRKSYLSHKMKCLLIIFEFQLFVKLRWLLLPVF